MEDFLSKAFDTGDIKIVMAALAVYIVVYFQRKGTAEKRNEDSDNINMRVTLLEHDLNSMKETVNVFGSKLDKILEELTQIKIELSKKEDK